MRLHLTALLLGLGVLAAAASPSLACAFHDEAATSSQQQTVQAQPQQPSQTSTQ